MRFVATMRVIPALALLAIGGFACGTDERQPEPAATAPPAAATAPPSNAQLSTAVQAKYYADDTIRGRRIDVRAENGTVTLRGTLQTDAARQHAVDLARNVNGVVRVDDQLEVRDSSTSTQSSKGSSTTGTTGRAADLEDTAQPAWITTKIQGQYFIDPDIKPWNIDVTTASGGVVTLEGAVNTVASKDKAVRIARDTEGVTRVEDRLRVRADTSSRPAPSGAGTDSQPDAWVTAKIQAKYFIDDDVKGRNIDVDTSNGVVTLTGSVATEAERRQAVALARSTDGVSEVKDTLKVDPAAATDATATSGAASADASPLDRVQRPDGWITMKIQAKYFLDTDVKGHRIDVDTRRGVVTLHGTVATPQQKQEAEQIARETEGVKRVVNQVAVGTTPGS